MQGLDYYMDGLLHEYLNQPEEEDEAAQAEGVLALLNDYYEDEE